MIKPILLGAAMMSMALPAMAQLCSPYLSVHTATENFVDNADGTITDARTGLMWTKCSLGQTYNYDTAACDGVPQGYNWEEALQQVEHINNDADVGAFFYNDWRMPNIKALGSLLERKCFDPMINLAVFPNTPSFPYHSSTPDPLPIGQQADALKYINFEDGLEFESAQNNLRYLRLVRDVN